MYEYKIVSFEFANASTTFQIYINVALRKYLDVFAFVYINDIFIFFKTLKKHETHVRVVLERLLQYKLYVNIKKSEFNVVKTTFLSFIIIRDDVKMNSNKIEMIVNWSESHSHKDVQIFLRFINFYRRFIKEFFRVANALSALLKRSDKNKFHIFFEFTSNAKKSFEKLRQAFFTTSLFRHFDSNRKIKLETDASNFVISEIIFQLNEAIEQWHSIVFWFRKMTSVERNYDADESEMFIIVKACKQWRHYVENAKHQILIIIDHVNLRTFFIIKILSRRKIKWWKKFSKFDFLIEYRSKRLNSANAFSKRSDYAIDSAKSEVQCIVTNSLILNDTSQSTRESRLASKKSSTRNVIVICKWFLTREQKNFDEDKISINKQIIELFNNVRFIFTIIEAIKKSFRKKRIDAIRKRLENENYESETFVFFDDAKCVNRKIIEKIAIMNDVFVSRFLKLRIAFLTLQKNDQLAQRMRFHCAESQLMKRNFENQNKDDSNADTQSSSEDDAIAQRICKDWRFKRRSRML